MRKNKLFLIPIFLLSSCSYRPIVFDNQQKVIQDRHDLISQPTATSINLWRSAFDDLTLPYEYSIKARELFKVGTIESSVFGDYIQVVGELNNIYDIVSSGNQNPERSWWIDIPLYFSYQFIDFKSFFEGGGIIDTYTHSYVTIAFGYDYDFESLGETIYPYYREPAFAGQYWFSSDNSCRVDSLSPHAVISPENTNFNFYTDFNNAPDTMAITMRFSSSQVGNEGAIDYFTEQMLSRCVFYTSSTLTTIALNTTDSKAYQEGYWEGYEDGKSTLGNNNVVANAFTYIKSAFESMNVIMSVEILPNISLWTLVAIPIVLGVLFFILKIVGTV
jgi:hypothetical protein